MKKDRLDKRFRLGLLLDGLFEKYQTLVWQGLVDGAVKHQVDLVSFIGSSLDSPFDYMHQRNMVYQYPREVDFDAFLIMSASISSFIEPMEFKSFYRHFASTPLLSLGMDLEDHLSIVMDNRQGMRELLDHFILDHGCRNIGFIRGPRGNPEAEARFEVYKEALLGAGIPYREEMVFQGDFYKLSGARGVAYFAENRIPLDALVAANDIMALDALAECRCRGIDIPGTFLIGGFDDIPFSSFSQPSLTTVHQPLYEMGLMGIEKITAFLSGEEVPRLITLPAGLVTRESCGCGHITPSPKLKTDPRGFHEFTQELVNAYSMEKLRTVVVNLLPSLGIEECYVLAYSGRDLSSMELILEMNSDLLLPGQRVFPFTTFLTSLLTSGRERKTFLVLPLYYKDEHLGIVVFRDSSGGGEVYENLAIHFSSALKGITLVSRIQGYTHYLEKELRNRSEELKFEIKENRDRLLRNLLKDNLSENDLYSLKFHFNLSLEKRPLQLLLVDLGISPGEEIEGFVGICRKILEEPGGGVVFQTRGQIVAFLFHPLKRKEAPALQALLSSGKEILGSSLFLFLGNTGRRARELYRSYRNAAGALKERFFLQSREICLETEFLSLRIPGTDSSSKKEVLRSLDLRAHQLFLAIEMSRHDSLEPILKEISRKVVAHRFTEDEIKAFYINILFSLINNIKREPGVMAGLFSRCRGAVATIEGMNNFYTLTGFFLSEIKALASLIGSTRTNKDVMENILAFLESNYNKELKLKVLASSFNYNSTYFGKLFKRYTGDSFRAYLEKLRITKAREMLKGNVKVCEVARQVGFNNVDYFSAKFKKYTGHSPGSFKKEGQP